MLDTDVWRRACALVAIVMLLIANQAVAGDVVSPQGVGSLTPLRERSARLAQQSRAMLEEATALTAHVETAAARRQRVDDGRARSANFSVSAPSGNFFADEILSAAERYRRDISRDWLGDVLPDGVGKTYITFEPTARRDEGLAMLNEGRDELRNRIWLRTSADRALGTTLAHEIAHVVLGERFGDDLPAWVTEGISCQYDDRARHVRRDAIVAHFVGTKQWPSLARLLDAKSIAPTDQVSYAMAVSLTDFLVSLDDRHQFVEFVARSRHAGWDAALESCYGIADTDALQQHWQTWASRDALYTASR